MHSFTFAHPVSVLLLHLLLIPAKGITHHIFVGLDPLRPMLDQTPGNLASLPYTAATNTLLLLGTLYRGISLLLELLQHFSTTLLSNFHLVLNLLEVTKWEIIVLLHPLTFFTIFLDLALLHLHVQAHTELVPLFV